ncbi:src-like-adapter 2 isoform 2-T3 [Theristicus caerulescens]
MAPPQRAWPTLRPNPGHRTRTFRPISLRGLWNSTGARGSGTACQGVPRTCPAAPRAVLSAPAGAGRPWGTGCPCAARRGSASTHCLRRWLYEGVSRQKAEELLLRPGNRSGSFLIRESQTRRGCYSLSVRRSERASWDSVTHYRIHRLENGWLYISPRLTFPSLHDLVDHYSGNAPPDPRQPQSVCGDALRPAGREGGGKWRPVPHLPRCPWGWGAGGGHPADAAGSLPRVWRGAVLPPQRALFHGRGEGGPRPCHARCCEEAITRLGQDRQLPPVLRGRVLTRGGLSHQPGPTGSHQLLPPPDRDGPPRAGPHREGGKEQLRAGPRLAPAPQRMPGPR